MDEKKGIKKTAKSFAAWMKAHKVITAIIIVILLALIGLLIFLHARSGSQNTEAEAEIVSVEKRDLVQSLTLSGTVESGAAYSVTSSLTDVEVKQVNVKVGDSVRKGDIIAVLDDTELRENVDSASRNLSSTKRKNSKDISSAKRSLRNAEEDEAIQTGRASEDADKAVKKYNTAAKELAAKKSELKNARSELDSALKKLEDAERAAKDIDKKIDGLQAEIDECAKQIEENEKEIKSGVTKEKEEELREENDDLWDEKREKEEELAACENDPKVKAEARAESEYKSADSKVSSLEKQVKTAGQKAAEAKDARDKALEVKEDARRTASRTVQEQKESLSNAYDNASESLESPRKELRKAQKDLDASKVVADADGIVTAVNVKPGDKYKGDAIAVVQDDSSYRVSATADQYDISSLAVGQDADITITAADMADTEGRLIYVGSTPMVSETGEVDTSGGSSTGGSSGANYRVETVILEPSEKMRIGMTAKVVVTVWKKNDCLAVPDEAIRTDENGNNYIVVTDDKGKTRNIDVKYGMKTDYYSEITGDGIEEGMQVIVPSYDDMDAGGEDTEMSEG